MRAASPLHPHPPQLPSLPDALPASVCALVTRVLGPLPVFVLKFCRRASTYYATMAYEVY